MSAGPGRPVLGAGLVSGPAVALRPVSHGAVSRGVHRGEVQEQVVIRRQVRQPSGPGIQDDMSVENRNFTSDCFSLDLETNLREVFTIETTAQRS